jgi:phage tail protein X
MGCVYLDVKELWRRYGAGQGCIEAAGGPGLPARATHAAAVQVGCVCLEVQELVGCFFFDVKRLWRRYGAGQDCVEAAGGQGLPARAAHAAAVQVGCVGCVCLEVKELMGCVCLDVKELWRRYGAGQGCIEAAGGPGLPARATHAAAV